MINNVYQALIKYFSVLWGINVIYMLILSFKLVVNGSQSAKTNSNSQEGTSVSLGKYEFVMLLISGISFLGATLLVIFEWKQHWFLMLLCALSVLRLIHYGLSSVITVSSIIKDTRTQKLSFAEKCALMVLACLFFSLNSSKLLNTFISLVCANLDSYLLDLSLGSIYLVAFFLVLFGCVSFLQTPLSLFATGYMHIVARIPTSFRQKVLQAIQDKDSHVRTKFWCASFIAFIRRCRKFWKLLMHLCVPLVVAADFLMTLLAYPWGVIREILIYFLRILRQLAKMLNKLSKKITNWSDRQVVAMSFRVAIVASITSIVIINRIDSIFVHVEESTAILEFIASAVVIPVIYSWINTWLEKRKHAKT